MALPLVDNWKDSSSWLTVRLGAACALWGQLPAESQAAALNFIGLSQERLLQVVGIAVIVFRIYKQRKVLTTADFQKTQTMERPQAVGK